MRWPEPFSVRRIGRNSCGSKSTVPWTDFRSSKEAGQWRRTAIRRHCVKRPLTVSVPRSGSRSIKNRKRIMESDIIRIDNQGVGFRDAPAQTEMAARFRGLSEKETLRLRICAEEMLRLARSINGEIEADFWLESEGKRFELHMSTAVCRSVYQNDPEALRLSVRAEPHLLPLFFGGIGKSLLSDSAALAGSGCGPGGRFRQMDPSVPCDRQHVFSRSFRAGGNGGTEIHLRAGGPGTARRQSGHEKSADEQGDDDCG